MRPPEFQGVILTICIDMRYNRLQNQEALEGSVAGLCSGRS